MSFSAKFFDDATLRQMNSDLALQHQLLAEKCKNLRHEKHAIRKKLDEVVEAIAEVDAETQSRFPQAAAMFQARWSGSSSTPTTDAPPASQESIATLRANSVAISDASHVANADEHSFHFGDHSAPNSSAQLHQYSLSTFLDGLPTHTPQLSASLNPAHSSNKTLALSTLNSNISAGGGVSQNRIVLPPNPLGEETSSNGDNNNSPHDASLVNPPAPSSPHHTFPPSANIMVSASSCADASATYRFQYQLPREWRHLGTPANPIVPQVSLVYLASPPNRSLEDDIEKPPQNERPGHGCNVHDALLRRYGPQHFSYHPYRIDETEPKLVAARAAHYRGNHPDAMTVLFYVQMFPTELISVGGRVLESILRDTLGDDGGVVINCEAVAFNAVRATVSCQQPYQVCHAIRCRVMADRHGFWYVKSYEAFLHLREYCNNLRYLSQPDRHFITDGLASIPLICEFALETSLAILPPPSSQHEPYDLILGRDPNHKTLFPFERQKTQRQQLQQQRPHSPTGGTSDDNTLASIASATAAHNSSPDSVLQAVTPFNPASRPRPPNEIYQHFHKLQGKLANVLKGRTRSGQHKAAAMSVGGGRLSSSK